VIDQIFCTLKLYKISGQTDQSNQHHALKWWVEESPKLSKKARQAVKSAARRRELIASAFSFYEIATFERRRRVGLKISINEWLDHLRLLPELTIQPVTDEIAKRAGGLGDGFPGDPGDRLIAATALVLDAPLVTADTKLHMAPGLTTIW
jgi:PIN domain nuclease of toxin-antitoxin system